MNFTPALSVSFIRNLLTGRAEAPADSFGDQLASNFQRNGKLVVRMQDDIFEVVPSPNSVQQVQLHPLTATIYSTPGGSSERLSPLTWGIHAFEFAIREGGIELA
jgi:hypothetical protein